MLKLLPLKNPDLSYFIDAIEYYPSLLRNFLPHIDLKNGDFFVIAPPDSNNKKIYDFETGGGY
jgi:hypothetical protein